MLVGIREWITGHLLILAGVAIFAAAIAGTYGGWKWRDYQAKADQLEQAKVANKALQDEIDRVASLTNKLRDIEHEAAAAMLTARDLKEKELKDVADKKDRVITGLRHDLRLRDPYRQAERPAETGRSETASAPGIVLPADDARLSGQLAEYLVGEASRADTVVVELNSCRRIPVQQHAQCGSLLQTAFNPR